MPLSAYRILIEGGQKQKPQPRSRRPDRHAVRGARSVLQRAGSPEVREEREHREQPHRRDPLAPGPGLSRRALSPAPEGQDQPRSAAAKRALSNAHAQHWPPRGKVVGPPMLFGGSRGGGGMAVEAHVGAPQRQHGRAAQCLSAGQSPLLFATARCCTPRCRAMASFWKRALSAARLARDARPRHRRCQRPPAEARSAAVAGRCGLQPGARSDAESPPAPWLRGVWAEESAAQLAPAVGAERVYTVGATTPVLAEARPAYGLSPGSASASSAASPPVSQRPRSAEHQLPLTAFARRADLPAGTSGPPALKPWALRPVEEDGERAARAPPSQGRQH